jgi:hypothetical protein
MTILKAIRWHPTRGAAIAFFFSREGKGGCGTREKGDRKDSGTRNGSEI